MKENTRFYVCKHCGNLVGMIHDAGVDLYCCGKPMSRLNPNTTEAATEKHLPVIAVNGSEVRVEVGSNHHPMSEEHQISWVYLETEQGGQRKAFKSTEEPVANFALTGDDQPVAAFAYCNLHGLWKTELKK